MSGCGLLLVDGVADDLMVTGEGRAVGFSAG